MSSKGIQWTGLHTTQVPTERHLQIDNTVVIISTLLCWLNISLGCLNSPSCICYYVYIWLCLSLFKVISCLSSTIANFLFKHNMHHFAVVLMSLYKWVFNINFSDFPGLSFGASPIKHAQDITVQLLTSNKLCFIVQKCIPMIRKIDMATCY